jgi:hypothetical protein
MSTPKIEILGTYRLSVTEALIQRKLSLHYGTEDGDVIARQAATDELNSIVLIELLVLNRDERFSVDHFLHEQPNLQAAHAQAAWLEVFLVPDGSSIVPTKLREVPTNTDLRLAFFVHFWDSNVPLQTTYGPIICPQVEAMPERLARLVPYESPD